MRRRKKFILGLLFLLFTFFFWVVRLWHFEELMGFTLDQALHISETYEMVNNHQIRLIGPMVSAKTALGRGFFAGPVYYYLLAVLGVFSNWDAVLITKILIIAWWLTSLMIILWLGKRFSWLVGVMSYGIFAAWPYLVQFSRKIWNPNYLPLVGVPLFWLLGSEKKKIPLGQLFLIGFLTGLGLNFDYSSGLWLPFLLFFLIKWLKEKRLKFWGFGLVLLGGILAELPLLLFELRHNFYNLRTIWFFIKHAGGFRISFYNFFLPLVPVIFWLIGFCLHRLEKNYGFAKTLGLSLLVIVLLFLNIDFQGRYLVGFPVGWNVPLQKRTASLICQEARGTEFEIAATISGDTRATDLRWWLSKAGCLPMGVEEYPLAETLYLVAPQERPPEEETVWEVSAMKPFLVDKEIPLNDKLFLYKLVREKT